MGLHHGNQKKSKESVMNQHLLGRMCYAILILISLLTSLCTASDMDGLVSIHDERLNQSGNDVTTLTISLDYGAVKTACIIIIVTVMLWLLVKAKRSTAVAHADVVASAQVPAASVPVQHINNGTTWSVHGNYTVNNGTIHNTVHNGRQPIARSAIEKYEQERR
jgi:hypothetical protein